MTTVRRRGKAKAELPGWILEPDCSVWVVDGEFPDDPAAVVYAAMCRQSDAVALWCERSGVDSHKLSEYVRERRAFKPTSDEWAALARGETIDRPSSASYAPPADIVAAVLDGARSAR